MFVGDGDTDLNCAREMNLVFVGIKNEDNDYEEQSLPFMRYDLTDFTSLIHDLQEIDEPPRVSQ